MNETIMVSHSLDHNTHTGNGISLCLNTNSLISLISPNGFKFWTFTQLLFTDIYYRRWDFSQGTYVAQNSIYKTSTIFYSITKGIFKICQIERVMAL